MIKWSGLLPLGSVVLLKGAYKRLQIIGLVQADRETRKLYDYVAVPFPEGYVDEDHVVKFQTEDVDRIFAIGHLEEGAYEFLDHAAQRLKDLREGKMTYEEAMQTPWKKEAEKGAADEI